MKAAATPSVFSKLGKLEPLARFISSGFTHVLYVTPLFWFGELLQNKLYLFLSGEYGWYFPTSPYHWFSFASIPVWGASVLMMWTLYYFWFEPKKVAYWKRILIAGSVGWAGEWTTGFLTHKLTGGYLQVWNNTWLEYISLSALPWWCVMACLYHVLAARFEPWLKTDVDVNYPEAQAAVNGRPT